MKLSTALYSGISVIGLGLLVASPALSRIGVNFRPLSSLEEPLAREVFGTTVVLRGLIDLPIGYSIENNENAHLGPIANFELGVETTLNNRWDVGISYFGEYDDTRNDEYDDNVAAYISGAWGTIVGGNIGPLVREETRRARGVGNGLLAFDDNYGGLNDWAGGYVGRFGVARLSAVMDDDANYDVGLTVQRPLGNKDYRMSVRHTNGRFESEDGLNEMDAKSISVVSEIVYGSSRFDIGAGYEHLSDVRPVIGGVAATDINMDRWFTSAGFSTKAGVWSLSAEGHYGEVEGQEEKSFAVGVQRDIARGLSANLGLNYEDAQIQIGNTNFINTKDTSITASLRYEF